MCRTNLGLTLDSDLYRDAQIGSEVSPPETPVVEVVCFPASLRDFNPGYYCKSP